MASYTMRDPTAETAAVLRERLPPPTSLAGKAVALLSISKERSDEFMDTKPAPEAVLQDIVERCDLVVEALTD